MNDLYWKPQHQQHCGAKYDHGGQETSGVAHNRQVDHLGKVQSKNGQ